MPNVVQVSRNIYLVRTQAGFRKAFKKYRSGDWCWRDKDAYPRMYPALMQFVMIQGYQPSCIDITDTMLSVVQYSDELKTRHPGPTSTNPTSI